MNATARTTAWLAALLVCITGQATSADVFVSELPDLLTTYVPGMEPITTSIDYRGGTGGISQLNSIRVEFTGTGVPGMDPFNNELPIELVVTVSGFRDPVVIGPFDQTPIDFELFELWGHLDFGWSQSSNIVSVVIEPRIAEGTVVNNPFVSLSAATITVDFSDCGADIGCDGFVGIADLNVVLGNWNLTVPPGDAFAGDLNGDGFVGIEDLNWVLSRWNTGTPPGAVPEPVALALLAAGVLPLIRRRRR